MKMVSAAKLKRAQDAVTQMRPYANKLGDILANLSSTMEGGENALTTLFEVLRRPLFIAFFRGNGG